MPLSSHLEGTLKREDHSQPGPQGAVEGEGAGPVCREGSPGLVGMTRKRVVRQPYYRPHLSWESPPPPAALALGMAGPTSPIPPGIWAWREPGEQRPGSEAGGTAFTQAPGAEIPRTP